MSTAPRIFVSYAREDFDRAQQLYQELETRGYRPWMDKFDLIGGEEWEPAIVRAVRQSDFFLFCASQKSVSKRGTIQKEIKEALDVWKEKLEDDIFFIPVRLDRCEIPAQISRFHWIDYFEGKEIDRIEKSIKAGLERHRGKQRPDELRVETRGIQQDKPQRFFLNVTYPEIQPATALGIAEINAATSSFALQLAAQFKMQVEATPEDLTLGRDPRNMLELLYQCELLNDHVVTYRFTQSVYFEGAAHPNSYTRTFNFWRQPFHELTVFDVFRDDAAFREVSRFCITNLARQISAGRTEPLKEDDDWLTNGAGPTPSNFSRFLFVPDGLLFVFDPYLVASYADGRHEVKMPLAIAEGLLKPLIKPMFGLR